MAEKTHLLSRWTQHIEGLNQSSMAFYTLVEGGINRRKTNAACGSTARSAASLTITKEFRGTPSQFALNTSLVTMVISS